MVYKVELPQVGESVTEGVIGKWLVAEGDRVGKYDPLVEVMTDKVNMEMPSPVAGVVARIVAAEGETVAIGAVIAEIDADDAEQAPAPAQSPAVLDTLGTLIQGVAVGPTGAANVPQRESRAADVPSSERGSGTARYSPAVRRLADEHGIDPALVTGTGTGGRVTRADIERHVESGATGDRRIPVTPVRRMIADNMVRSVTEIPHAWSTVEVDVTGLVALRASVKDRFRAEHGHPITYLAFAVSAAAAALREHPTVNSSWGGDHIVLRGRVNVGIAVAAPDGLVVPVIADADRRTVAELAAEIDRLAVAARAGALTPGDIRGGTFTLNNTGVLGSVASGPIIVPGQTAIITTEAVVKRPVVTGGDVIAVRSMMNLCMSFDHRVLDGADASEFMGSVKNALQAIGPDTALDRRLGSDG